MKIFAEDPKQLIQLIYKVAIWGTLLARTETADEAEESSSGDGVHEGTAWAGHKVDR